MLPGQSSDQGRLKFLRATLIGLFLVLPNLIWLVQTELVRGVYPTWLTLFPNVIFILFILTILSCLLKRIWPQVALSGSVCQQRFSPATRHAFCFIISGLVIGARRLRMIELLSFGNICQTG